jgi:hypothetical protein
LTRRPIRALRNPVVGEFITMPSPVPGFASHEEMLAVPVRPLKAPPETVHVNTLVVSLKDSRTVYFVSYEAGAVPLTPTTDTPLGSEKAIPVLLLLRHAGSLQWMICRRICGPLPLSNTATVATSRFALKPGNENPRLAAG